MADDVRVDKPHIILAPELRAAVIAAGAKATHPEPDGEDEATAAVVLGGILGCPEFVAAITGVAMTPAALRGNLGEDERCGRCGGANVIWSAPSPLWNLVMRGNDINGESQYGDLVCMGCFVVLAEAAGVTGRWRLYVEPEPEGLVKTTPSGRIWDPGSWLWRTPEEMLKV